MASSPNKITTMEAGIGTTIKFNASVALEDNYDGYVNPRLLNGVVVLLLMLWNIAGNSLVIYVYHFLTQKRTFSFYVKMMAILDLITAVTMLQDLIIKMVPVTTTSIELDVICRLTHFQSYSTSMINGCILTLIAYQRYRKICLPSKDSITLRQAKKTVIAASIVSVLISVFTLVINGPQKIHVEVEGRVVPTIICRYDKEFRNTKFREAASAILLIAFSLVLGLTIILHILVGRALKDFEHRRSVRNSIPCSPTSSYEGSLPMQQQQQGTNIAANNDEAQKRREQFKKARMSVFSNSNGGIRISTKMYRMFAIITAAFILSYLPHLIVLILNKNMNLDNSVLTFTQRFFLELAYNSPYINTITNPLIYSFNSTEFRDHCKQILRCRPHRRRR